MSKSDLEITDVEVVDEVQVITTPDPIEFGLEETKAKDISNAFQPMLSKMVELENEYNAIINQEVTEENVDEFKALRLKYVSVRKGTEKIHKEWKRFYLLGGRFVDGWKNAQLLAGESKEKMLKKKEEHFINLEQEKRNALLSQRKSELMELGMDEMQIPGGLGVMEESMFEMVKNGYKVQMEQAEAQRKKEAEAAEEQRLRDERDVVRRDLIAENDVLKYIVKIDYLEWEDDVFAEAMRGWLEMKANELIKERKRKERRDKLANLWNFIPEDFDINCDDDEYELVKSRAIIAKVEKEKEEERLREENARLKEEADLAEKKREEERVAKQKEIDAANKKAKDLADAKAKKDREEAEEKQRLLNLDDKERFDELLKDLEAIKIKHEGKFRSDKNIGKFNAVKILIDKILVHVKK